MKPEPANATWKAGETCFGFHDCPDLSFPNHHEARCECTAKAVRPCVTCNALVCATCKLTIF